MSETKTMNDSVTIRLLLFGMTAEVIGVREMEASANTSSELLASIVAEHPRLARHKLLVSINQKHTRGDTKLCDDDEVAIFTAVSGG